MGDPSIVDGSSDAVPTPSSYPPLAFYRAATDDTVTDTPAVLDEQPDIRYFIVGVDFGTTFSCVSVLWRHKDDTFVDAN